MQKIIILALLLVCVFSQYRPLTPDQLVGAYQIGSQCSSYSCPETYYGSYDLTCPNSGHNQGSIWYGNNGYYYLGLYTYQGVFSQTGYFEVPFTQNNILYDSVSTQSQVQIPLNNGYTLNLMPCYSTSTASVCTGAYNELAVWKTRGSVTYSGCNFNMIME
ncbi:hypothetical protein PPERSA_06107 [Pseudocohnilembus persalinus]|uniref:Uncharacterized protein n=1 Tax=Pseudocohnilembus persalinus TaxID=266149 RepID=A0A0V0QVL4_PSEPJ|nr:hypothetical protein PPERSA_06107 [Pseudocohnilembus persalinus]|eukprot:KRX06225.1 hypothetical protein PPERSA_06107 [Pseudocohnilembus persalinus]